MADDLDPDAAAEQILRQAEAGAIDAETRSDIFRRQARRDQALQDEVLLAQLREMQAEIRRVKLALLTPRNGFLRLFIRDLETNPRAQFSVHKAGMWYWLLNFPAVTALFFFKPDVWLKWGLYITLIYSIYANFATDYAGMSSAMAADQGRFLPPIPGEPFSGGRGGHGGGGGQGGKGGKGGAGQDGDPGEPGEQGQPGEQGEQGEPGD